VGKPTARAARGGKKMDGKRKWRKRAGGLPRQGQLRRKKPGRKPEPSKIPQSEKT